MRPEWQKKFVITIARNGFFGVSQAMPTACGRICLKEVIRKDLPQCDRMKGHLMKKSSSPSSAVVIEILPPSHPGHDVTLS